MKRNPGYLLQTIANTDYLLPYGQLVADHYRGISLNETGVYIWNLLEKEKSREDLLSVFLTEFSSGDSKEKESLTSDLNQFLNQLIILGFIEDDEQDAPYPGWPWKYLNIGGLTLAYYGPEDILNVSFLKYFYTDPVESIDQHIFIRWGAPRRHTNGFILLRNSELVVCERESDYLLIFPTFTEIYEVSLSKDGTQVTFYCRSPFSEELGEQFFHAMRFTFLYLAQKSDMYAIHSASICYQGKAWLFSASAGTGKSTHARLWNDLYQVANINGDLNLLAIENGVPVIHGIPWCGTSEIYEKRTFPLGGIVLLKRSDKDAVVELPLDRKILMITQRFISPTWGEEQLQACLDFSGRLAEKISICQLRCTKNPSAAETLKNWIDQNQTAGESYGNHKA